MVADEFNFLWSEIQNYIAEADAGLIPVPGQKSYIVDADMLSCRLHALVLSICCISNCVDGGIRITLQM